MLESKTSSPQKLFDYDCVTLYQNLKLKNKYEFVFCQNPHSDFKKKLTASGGTVNLKVWILAQDKKKPKKKDKLGKDEDNG